MVCVCVCWGVLPTDDKLTTAGLWKLQPGMAIPEVSTELLPGIPFCAHLPARDSSRALGEPNSVLQDEMSTALHLLWQLLAEVTFLGCGCTQEVLPTVWTPSGKAEL